MIHTNVKKLGTDEHIVNVRVPQAEYERIYADQISKLQARIKLPGFRPGKTPPALVEKKFGARAHEDAVSELVQHYYAEAIEKSGLTPAIRPELELPDVQSGEDFEFTLKVVTWPKVALKPLSGLSIEAIDIGVADSDIRSVMDRLMEKQVHFEPGSGRKARQGDEIIIDFTGFIDDVPFEGGHGEDIHLVLGEGKFIPGFEEGLSGAAEDEEHTLKLTFPEDYQDKTLAEKQARFEIQVKSVGAPLKAKNEEELAKMLGFDDAEALRKDVRHRLEHEAEQAELEANRRSVFDAMLKVYKITLPEAMVRQDMQRISQRIVQSMKDDGVEPTAEMFESVSFQDEIRHSAERSLKVSLLLDAVREQHGIELSDEEVGQELDRQAAQYPEKQRTASRNWMHGRKEEMSGLRDRLLEKKCMDCIMGQAKTSVVSMNFSEWQEKQNSTPDESRENREDA